MPPDAAEAPVWDTAGLILVHFSLLSLMAVGGGVIMLAPEMQRYVVESHHWLTTDQFAAAYTIAQAAPGPNLLYVTLVGWQAAGLAGALAATLAMVGPPAAITLAVLRLSAISKAERLGRAVTRGLIPISVGLVLATGWVLLRPAENTWRGTTLSLVTVVVVLRTRINPVWLIGAGALAGIAELM